MKFKWFPMTYLHNSGITYESKNNESRTSNVLFSGWCLWHWILISMANANNNTWKLYEIDMHDRIAFQMFGFDAKAMLLLRLYVLYISIHWEKKSAQIRSIYGFYVSFFVLYASIMKYETELCIELKMWKWCPRTASGEKVFDFFSWHIQMLRCIFQRLFHFRAKSSLIFCFYFAFAVTKNEIETMEKVEQKTTSLFIHFYVKRKKCA